MTFYLCLIVEKGPCDTYYKGYKTLAPFDPSCGSAGLWCWLGFSLVRMKMYLRAAAFSEFLFDSFFHSLLRSRATADGAAAGLIVFITKASAS